MTDIAVRLAETPWRRRRPRYVRLWLWAVLRRAAYRVAIRRARTVRTWRRRQELLDMFALDDASLRAFGVTRAEIVIALEDGRRVVLSPKLASTLEARRHDAVQACEANGSAR